MAINRPGSTSRNVPTNYIGKEAGARLREIVGAAQQREMQALEVDRYEVLYYHRVDCSTICTCHRKERQGSRLGSNPGVGFADDDLSRNIANPGGDEEIIIDHSHSIFGSSNTTRTMDEDGSDNADLTTFDDELAEGTGNVSEDTLFGSANDCGICYRTGLVPGYELYGHNRQVFTTHVLEDSYGYTVNTTTSPESFEKVDDVEGYVDFALQVPKYFKAVRFSVRNNQEHLDDENVYSVIQGTPKMTVQELRYRAGQQILIRVKAEQFTHLVVEFELGTEPVILSISNASVATDWTVFDQYGTLNATLPPTIDRVATSDVIYLIGRKQTFKVTDMTELRTAENRNLDWPVQLRVLQPQETLKNIYKTRKMY